jgi:Spy/CpxP family protein refolding chaperone
MPNKYRFWLVLTLLVAFAAGLLGGIFSERYFFHPREHARARRNAQKPPDLEGMAKDLGLSLDQKERIKQIFETNDVKFKDLRTEMHQRLSDIRAEIKDQIDAVLTPEQKQKLDNIIAQHQSKDKKESEKKGQSSVSKPSPEKPKGEMK